MHDADGGDSPSARGERCRHPRTAAAGLALIAGWMRLVLTGRVLMMVGFRAALGSAGRSHPLMGFAVHVTAISVALEIGATGLDAGEGTLSAESSAVGSRPSTGRARRSSTACSARSGCRS